MGALIEYILCDLCVFARETSISPSSSQRSLEFLAISTRHTMLMISNTEGQDDLVIGIESSPTSCSAGLVCGYQISSDTSGQRTGADSDPLAAHLSLVASASDDGSQDDRPGCGARGAEGFDGCSRRNDHKGYATNSEYQTQQPTHQTSDSLEEHALKMVGDLHIVVRKGTSQVNRHASRLTHHTCPVRTAWQ